MLRRPVRSLLTVTGVGLAVGAVVSLVGIASGFERSFVDLYARRGVDLVVVRSGVTERLTSALTESLGERIARTPGVRSVTPVLMDVVSFEDLDLFGVVVQGLKHDALALADLKIDAGRVLAAGDRQRVILGAMLARNLGKSVGQAVEILEGEPFEVVGIFESYNVFENGAMIVLLDELQRLMDREDQVTAFNVRAAGLADRAAIERLAAAIEQVAPGLQAMPTEDYVNTDSKIRVARSMAWLTSTIALVLGTVGVLNTMIMSVFERTREIGILRAMGWRKSRVMKMILWESVLLSLAGAVIGTVLALVGTRFLSRLPSASGIVDGGIAPMIVVQGFLIALVVGLLGGAYPARRGARMLPTEALHHE